ncbi:MAG: hypothetical protein KatS3mg059_1545 [Thermomicrobiales bacterium]|nr:MAG: hypothetical protein KatS3mg059_1545 [Thermomicrobiales bacterium]
MFGGARLLLALACVLILASLLAVIVLAVSLWAALAHG